MLVKPMSWSSGQLLKLEMLPTLLAACDAQVLSLPSLDVDERRPSIGLLKPTCSYHGSYTES